MKKVRVCVCVSVSFFSPISMTNCILELLRCWRWRWRRRHQLCDKPEEKKRQIVVDTRIYTGVSAAGRFIGVNGGAFIPLTSVQTSGPLADGLTTTSYICVFFLLMTKFFIHSLFCFLGVFSLMSWRGVLTLPLPLLIVFSFVFDLNTTFGVDWHINANTLAFLQD